MKRNRRQTGRQAADTQEQRGDGFPGVQGDTPAAAGDAEGAASTSGSGRCPGGQSGSSFRCCCLGIPRDRGAWWATVQGATESQTRLSRRAHRATVETERDTGTRRQRHRDAEIETRGR